VISCLLSSSTIAAIRSIEGLSGEIVLLPRIFLRHTHTLPPFNIVLDVCRKAKDGQSGGIYYRIFGRKLICRSGAFHPSWFECFGKQYDLPMRTRSSICCGIDFPISHLCNLGREGGQGIDALKDALGPERMTSDKAIELSINGGPSRESLARLAVLMAGVSDRAIAPAF